MSGDNSYSASLRETPGAAGSDHGVIQARSAGTELAQAPPAESMSRQECASYRRRGPAVGTGDAATGDNGTGHDGVPGRRDDLRGDAAGQAHGMSRSEYAGYMRQGFAAGTDDTGSAGTVDYGDLGGDDDPASGGLDTGDQRRGDEAGAQAQGMTRSEYAGYMRQGSAAGPDDPDREPGTTHAGSGTDVSQLDGTDQATADLRPAAQPDESLTPQSAVAENGAGTHDGRGDIGELDEDSNPPAESRPGQQVTDNRAHEATSTVDGQLNTAGTDLAPAEPRPATQVQAVADHSTSVEPAGVEDSKGDLREPPSPEVPPESEHGDDFAGRSAQPDGDHPVPGTSPEASLKQELADIRDQMQAQVDERLQAAEARYQASVDSLKAEYEAGIAQDRQQMDEVRAELQALRGDRPEPAPDVPGNSGIEADQPYAGDRELTTAQEDARGVKHEGDRPGLWSNAKSALYGAVGSTVTLAALDQFASGAPHPVVDIATGGLTIIAAFVPTMREGWKRRHDDSPGKP